MYLQVAGRSVVLLAICHRHFDWRDPCSAPRVSAHFTPSWRYSPWWRCCRCPSRPLAPRGRLDGRQSVPLVTPSHPASTSRSALRRSSTQLRQATNSLLQFSGARRARVSRLDFYTDRLAVWRLRPASACELRKLWRSTERDRSRRLLGPSGYADDTVSFTGTFSADSTSKGKTSTTGDSARMVKDRRPSACLR
jgi:hypothetical protein